MSNILVVEDEEIIRQSLKRLLEKNRYTVAEAGSVDEAMQQLKRCAFDLIITDLRLPGASGNTLITFAQKIPVLVMTSYASLKSAVESIKLGAKNYIAKPFNHEELLQIVKDTLHECALTPIAKASELKSRTKPFHKQHNRLPPQSADTEKLTKRKSSEGFQGIIGRSRAMCNIFNKIEKVAPTDTTVLILGESGTGKELVAKALHKASARREGPLVSVNCAAIPQSLIESELFGHEKGAFTGANNCRKGLVEAAHGGTLFLDEIGEIPLEAQARLLRLLQEKEIRKVGSIESRKIDVRLVAATHRDLKKLSNEGLFREDLYYRLHVVELLLPPLREREEDVEELAQFFLRKLSSERLNIEPAQFTEDAIRTIRQYHWPGNVRELENAIERALILCEQGRITKENLGIQPSAPSLFSHLNKTKLKLGRSLDKDEPAPESELSLEDYFQRFVLENQDQMTETQIAHKLGISRKCLWERRQRLGIPRKRTKQ